MKTRSLMLAIVVTGLVAGALYAAYELGMNRGMQMSESPGAGVTDSPGAPAPVASAERKVLYWHDPMVPGQKFDKPGKSPFMDMQLVPVYADAGSDGSTVTVSPRVQQNLGVRTAEVTQGSLAQTFEAVGSVAYNERDTAVVQARANGYIERLYVRAPLDAVAKGKPLADVYVPDWVAAQEEYLTVKRMGTTAPDALLDGARQRMRLAGMTDDLVRKVETTGTVHARMTLVAPIGGIVAELGAREGMTLMAGATLFRINGLGTVWVNAEVPESAAGLVHPGAAVEARTTALPGTVFRGRVSALLPEVSTATRTLKARVELANPRGQLLPGMFATISFMPGKAGKQVLLVPSEAVIRTGQRSVVLVAQAEGRFLPVDVEIGAESNGQTEIRKGLEAGQRIVVSGQFLIDSEASLRGTTLRMGEHSAPQTTGAATHRGTGKVEAIGKDELTLSHEPMPTLQWPAMTMGFKPPADGMPKNIAVGDSVEFEIRDSGNGTYQVTTISRARAGAPPAAASPRGAGK